MEENKIDLVKGKLTTYYAYKREEKKLYEDLGLIVYKMNGVSGVDPSKEPIHGNVDRQHTLIVLGEKKQAIEDKIKAIEVLYTSLYNQLHLFETSETDMRIIELRYLHKMSYTKIANLVGYAGKEVIYKRFKKIYSDLSRYQ